MTPDPETRRGGKRPGAGRKPSGAPTLRKLTLYLSDELFRKLGGSSAKAREILEANT